MRARSVNNRFIWLLNIVFVLTELHMKNDEISDKKFEIFTRSKSWFQLSLINYAIVAYKFWYALKSFSFPLAHPNITFSFTKAQSRQLIFKKSTQFPHWKWNAPGLIRSKWNSFQKNLPNNLKSSYCICAI